MKKYSFVVLTNPVAGKEEAYNDWYDNIHLADVCRVPGFTGAKRYRATAAQPVEEVRWRYLAIYDIETDDLAAALSNLSARSGTEQMRISEALDVAGVHAVVYEAL